MNINNKIFTYGASPAAVWLANGVAKSENSKYRRRIGNLLTDVYTVYKLINHQITDTRLKRYFYMLVFHDMKQEILKSELGKFKTTVLNVLSSIHREHNNTKQIQNKLNK